MRLAKDVFAVLAGIIVLCASAIGVDSIVTHIFPLRTVAETISLAVAPLESFLGGYTAGWLSPRKGALKGALVAAPFSTAFVLGMVGWFLTNVWAGNILGAFKLLFGPLVILNAFAALGGLLTAALGGALGSHTRKLRNESGARVAVKGK